MSEQPGWRPRAPWQLSRQAMPDEPSSISGRPAIVSDVVGIIAGVILLVLILSSDWPTAFAVVPAAVIAWAAWQLAADIRTRRT